MEAVKEIKEEYGINAMNRTAKSQLIKGLDSGEAIVIIGITIVSIFIALVLFMLHVRFGLYLQVVILPGIYTIVKVLHHFHKTEKPGFIVSYMCYLLEQPKKIYARHGHRIFEKKE